MTKQERFCISPKPPIFPTCLPSQVLAIKQLDDYDCFESTILTGGQLLGARCVEFKYVELQSIEMLETNFARCSLTDVRLQHCNLSNTELEKAAALRIEAIECGLVGLRCLESTLQHAVFLRCQASLSQFCGTVFKAARFEGCNLQEADFQDADLRGVTFAKCDLSNALLFGAKLEGANFQGSTIDGIQLRLNEIQGAVFDAFQASYILQRYARVIIV